MSTQHSPVQQGIDLGQTVLQTRLASQSAVVVPRSRGCEELGQDLLEAVRCKSPDASLLADQELQWGLWGEWLARQHHLPPADPRALDHQTLVLSELGEADL